MSEQAVNEFYKLLGESENVCPFCGDTVPQLEWHIVCKLNDLDEKVNSLIGSKIND